ncbi:MAG: hypothetical protein RL326_874 [Pseudomonadota bacterium]|jgi:hypothetical protein
MKQLATVVFATLMSASIALADDAKPSKLPKSGLLAVSSLSGAGNTVTTDAFGGEDFTGADVAPITGSVSRVGESSWVCKVFNNSKDEYSINVDLKQQDLNGSQVKFGSYSFRLKPGASDQITAEAGLNARRAELWLRSYKNLTLARAKKQDGAIQ